jgi:hypothetical protein
MLSFTPRIGSIVTFVPLNRSALQKQGQARRAKSATDINRLQILSKEETAFLSQPQIDNYQSMDPQGATRLQGMLLDRKKRLWLKQGLETAQAKQQELIETHSENVNSYRKAMAGDSEANERSLTLIEFSKNIDKLMKSYNEIEKIIIELKKEFDGLS